MNFRKEEGQFQASNELYLLVKEYLKRKKMGFAKFCKKNNLPVYLTQKVLDRKIKMHIFPSFIIKIGRCIGVENNRFCTRYYKRQPTPQKDIELINRGIMLKMFSSNL